MFLHVGVHGPFGGQAEREDQIRSGEHPVALPLLARSLRSGDVGGEAIHAASASSLFAADSPSRITATACITAAIRTAA